ncbi:unnamed protein product [Ixodes persulcatus]
MLRLDFLDLLKSAQIAAGAGAATVNTCRSGYLPRGFGDCVWPSDALIGDYRRRKNSRTGDSLGTVEDRRTDFAMEAQYNLRSPAVKRLMREAKELHDATEEYFAQPLEDNLFEWHFTVRGPPESDFEGGVYHGRVILPPDYPMKPPSIILLTPNGRFEINKKICLSISGHHPESWQPSWSLRTALLAIIGFMPTHGSGAIGSLDYSTEERKQLAKKSQAWSCPSCGPVARLLKEPSESPDDREAADKEDRALAAQITFKGVRKQKLKYSRRPIIRTSRGPKKRPNNRADAGERPSTPNEAAASSEPAPPPQEPKPAAEANQEEAPEAVRRRMAAQILARRAERLFQQQQVAANREQVPLAAVTENGTATSTAGNDNMRLAYSATMWLLGSAFVGLLIRRLFFL